MTKVRFHFRLPISIFKEGKNYIAFSPVLDLSTCGKNANEAKKRFREAVELFFEELIQKNTLNTVLANLGWHKTRQNWQPPELVTQESEKMTIAAIV